MQARWDRVESELASHCQRGFSPDGDALYCPGNGPDCKPPDRPVLGRETWPICPRAMIVSRAWQECVRYQRAAHVSSIDGWPHCMTAAGERAITEIEQAVEDRLRDETNAKSKGKSGGPTFSGRYSEGH